MEIIIASPTAASAAATVITIKTNNGPPTSPKNPDKDTSVRLTAWSINSMHKRIVITLRLMTAPTARIVKSNAERPRYHDNGTILFLRQIIDYAAPVCCIILSVALVTFASSQNHRSHHRHQDEHRSYFEW